MTKDRYLEILNTVRQLLERSHLLFYFGRETSAELALHKRFAEKLMSDLRKLQEIGGVQ